jgi:tRNA (guanine-N7-)-methyltransferase
VTQTFPEKPLRSFGRRKGRRLHAGRKAALEQGLEQAGIRLPEKGTFLDAQQLFGRDCPLQLEIGFGQGEHLAGRAASLPQTGFIGCEPFMNGVGYLCQLMQEKALENLRIWADDVRLLLPHLPDGCLERVEILFPDPWPKSKHKKRRIVSRALLDELARLLPQGAVLQLATDNADYAAWMLELLALHPQFEWQARSPQDWKQPPADWVETKYQMKDNNHGGDSVFITAKRM